jgi:hypothetical protein
MAEPAAPWPEVLAQAEEASELPYTVLEAITQNDEDVAHYLQEQPNTAALDWRNLLNASSLHPWGVLTVRTTLGLLPQCEWVARAAQMPDIFPDLCRWAYPDPPSSAETDPLQPEVSPADRLRVQAHHELYDSTLDHLAGVIHCLLRMLPDAPPPWWLSLKWTQAQYDKFRGLPFWQVQAREALRHSVQEKLLERHRTKVGPSPEETIALQQNTSGGPLAATAGKSRGEAREDQRMLTTHRSLNFLQLNLRPMMGDLSLHLPLGLLAALRVAHERAMPRAIAFGAAAHEY